MGHFARLGLAVRELGGNAVWKKTASVSRGRLMLWWGHRARCPAGTARRPCHFISRRDGDVGGLAPDAHLSLAQMVNGAVGPLHGCGRERLRVGVAGRGVNGQQHIALAVVAVHLDFATVQPRAVTAPAPFDHHMIAENKGGDDGLDGGVVGRGLGGADDAEVAADGAGGLAAVLDELDEGEEAEERAGDDGRDGGGQGGRNEHGQHLRDGAGAGLRLRHGVGAGKGPFAHGRLPRLQEVEQPEAVGGDGGHLRGGQAHLGGVAGQLVDEVRQPDDLGAMAGGIIIIMFHRFVFGVLFHFFAGMADFQPDGLRHQRSGAQHQRQVMRHQ